VVRGRQLTGRLRSILEAIDDGDLGGAADQLADLEARAFFADDPYAGDLGYARWRLVGGDVSGCVDTLRRLVEGAGR